MKVGQRLALGVVLAALPVIAALEWVRRDVGQRVAFEGLAQLALTELENGGLQRCEAAPERFGGPLRSDDRPPFDLGPRPPRPPRARADRRAPVVLWAYRSDFTPANPHAPPLPAVLRDELEGGASIAGQPSSRDRPLTVAARTPWPDGPCAFVMALRPDPPPPVGGGAWLQYAVLALVLAAAALAVAGPLVRRIRRLTAAVGQASAGGYAGAVAVEGHDELAELAQAFNAAGDRIRTQVATLEQRAEALRAFLSNTTHDVMQPLTVLQGHLGALRRTVESGVVPDVGRIAACQEEAHYVASLIHNLTAAARLDSGAVPLRHDRLDLRAVVHRVVARHRPLAESRGLSLEEGVPEAPVEVEGDTTLLEQAVGNLVHNAVQHNTTGRHVAVVLDRDDGVFSLRVLDDGPGVDEAVLARLAEPRFRTESARQRHPDGQGLGLAIAHEAAERHGMQLELGRPEHGGFAAVLRGRVVNGEPEAMPTDTDTDTKTGPFSSSQDPAG